MAKNESEKDKSKLCKYSNKSTSGWALVSVLRNTEWQFAKKMSLCLTFKTAENFVTFWKYLLSVKQSTVMCQMEQTCSERKDAKWNAKNQCFG